MVGVFPGERGPAFAAVRTAVQAMALFVAYGLVYRFVPRVRQDRRAILVGALAATLLFLAARPLFLLAVARSETYRITYGPLALTAILMVWAWVVAFITLAGGQLAMLTNAALRDAPGAALCPSPAPSHQPERRRGRNAPEPG